MGDVITRFKLETTQYDSKLRDSAKRLSELTERLQLAGKDFNKFAQNHVQVAQSLGQVASGATNTKEKLRDLVNAYNMTARAYNNLTKEQQQGDFGRAMSASLQKLQRDITATKNELYSLGDAAKGGSALSAPGALGNFSQSLLGQLGLNGNLIAGLTSSTAALTAGIGLAAGAVTKATQAWVGYNNELAKQDQITQVTLGMQGRQAEQMTDAIRAISSTYGVDFREAVNAANTLMSQFGETGDSALQLLRDGMQGMIQGDGGKLLQMIQQYAPAFRDAGVSASQLVAVIQNSEGGIFTDQNMNAIVMGIKNIRLMTKATSEALRQVGIDGEEMTRQLNDGTLTIFDALRQVAEAIDKTGSGSQAAGQVMQQVFGRQGAMAGTKLGEAIASLNLNLDEMKTKTGELGEATANLERAYEDLNGAIRECFGVDGWEVMKKEIETALVGEVQNALTVVKLLEQAWDDLTEPIYNVATAAVEVIDKFGIIRDISNNRRVGAMFDVLKNYITGLITPAVGLYNTLKDIASLISGSRLNQTIGRTLTILGNSLPAVVTPGEGSGGGGGGGNGGGGGGSTTSRHGTSGTAKTPPPVGSILEQEAAVAELTKKWKEATDQAGRDGYLKELNEAKRVLAEMSGTAKAKTSVIIPEGSILAQEAAVAELTKKWKEATDQAGRDGYLKELNEAKRVLAEMSGTVSKIKQGFSGLTEGSLAAWISGQQSAAKGMQVGGADYLKTSANIVDAQTLSAVMKTAVENGIDIDASTREELWEKIISVEDIPDNTWEELLKVINEHLAALDIDPIKIDLKTGNISKAGKETADSWKAAAQAVGSVGNALQQINDPAAKVAGIVGEAVANIALGFAQATAKDSKLGVFGWIAAVAGGLGTMISTIAAIKSATAQQHYAQGGIVPGNDYTDNTPVLVSSGELILNRSQQDNIAQQLQGNTFGDNFALSAKFDGEDFWIMLNRNSVRRGRGTIALNKH